MSAALTLRRLEAIILVMRAAGPLGGVERRDHTGAIEWAQARFARKVADLAEKRFANTQVGGRRFWSGSVGLSSNVQNQVVGWNIELGWSDHPIPALAWVEGKAEDVTKVVIDPHFLFAALDGRRPMIDLVRYIHMRAGAEIVGL